MLFLEACQKLEIKLDKESKTLDVSKVLPADLKRVLLSRPLKNSSTTSSI